MKKLPQIESYKASNGDELRQLFAVAILRALSPMERKAVMESVA